MTFGFNPYVIVTGSKNSGILGVAKVNTTNNTPIRQIIAKQISEYLQNIQSFLNNFVSKKYATATDIKNIAILIQSGDFPITPL